MCIRITHQLQYDSCQSYLRTSTFAHLLPLRSAGGRGREGEGKSGGAMVLAKLPVPGRPTYLDYSRIRPYCACSRCGMGLFGYFFSRLSFLVSFSLSLADNPI